MLDERKLNLVASAEKRFNTRDSMPKKAKKSPEQLEHEIEALILERYGNECKFLLNVVEYKTGYSNSLTNDALYMFDYGAILLGRFCEDVAKDLRQLPTP